MSLTHAILGLLNSSPMTGYDLKTQCFDKSIANFWPADQAQIYRTLDKLHEQGHIESRIEIQEDRPNRKVYSITPTGKDELLRWLHEEHIPPVQREPFLVKLFFANELGNEEIIQHLEQQLAAHEERLASYHEVALPPFDSPQMNRELMMQRMTLDLGFRIEAAYLEWLKACIARIQGDE